MRLVLIFGPPAVGKMTVGREIVARSEFRLLHNHAVLEPVLEVFEFGTRPFNTLVREFRRRLLEEAAAAEVDLVLTYVWGLELAADLPTRLERNDTELRLLEKRSKRDREWSDQNVRELQQHVMNTVDGKRTLGHDLLEQHPHLRIDNTDLPPHEVADRILAWISR